MTIKFLSFLIVIKWIPGNESWTAYLHFMATCQLNNARVDLWRSQRSLFQTRTITADKVEEHSVFTVELNRLSIREGFNFVVGELLALWLILSLFFHWHYSPSGPRPTSMKLSVSLRFSSES
jgi:hypothetical protein